MDQFSKLRSSSQGLPAHRPGKPASNQWNEERVTRHFDHATDRSEDVYLRQETPGGFFYRRRQAIVMRCLHSRQGDVVVDLGCGPGAYASEVVERGSRYIGFDLSPRMIAHARRRHAHLMDAEFMVGDVGNLPLASNSVDGLLCLGMLEYVPKDDEVAYLAEMARVLKPGGRAVFSFLNAASPYWIWVERCYPLAKFVVRNSRAVFGGAKPVRLDECAGEALPTRRFRLKERCALLGSMGLEVTEESYFSINVLPMPLDQRLSGLSLRLNRRLEPLLEWPFLERLGMGFVISARKA